MQREKPRRRKARAPRGQEASGESEARHGALKSLKKRERTVDQAFVGSHCSSCVLNRIIRAFLFEEQKCVKQILAEKDKPAKSETQKPRKVKQQQ